jgi:membrane protein YdbS with pleckstrin-like domain
MSEGPELSPGLTEELAAGPVSPPDPGLADGVPRQLAPQFIRFGQIGGAIFTAVVSLGALITGLVLWLTAELPRWASLLILPAWLFVTAFLAWIAYAWPRRTYRHTFYVLDVDGLEIRTGVWWRDVMSIPRSRVQHIDVSQGPLERSFGLGRLIVYTAGTEHSRVELPGLDHATALRLRDHLLPRGSDDAV